MTDHLDRIEKLGRAPKTIYRWITERHYVSEASEIYLPEMDFLKKHFLLVQSFLESDHILTVVDLL